MRIQEHIPLQDFTTFKLPCTARFFAVVTTVEELQEAVQYAKGNSVPLFVLGGGSNTIFQKETIDALVVKNEIQGITVVDGDDVSKTVRFGAGLPWNDVVAYTVDHDLSGIEAMAKIPGTTGATPIQNVGAYGQEIKDTLVELEALNIETDLLEIFLNEDCDFAYRDSIFKHDAQGKYVITSVTLRLKTTPPGIPHYPGVLEYLTLKGISTPTVKDIADVIGEIRSTKLPDPAQIASVGSFFKNPIVEASVYEKIKKDYPNVKAFAVEDKYKIPAGWLIDAMGYKGKVVGNLEFYPNNALVVVNRGGATFGELQMLIDDVIHSVEATFGITLEPEPVFV